MSRFYLPLAVFAALVALLGIGIVHERNKDLVPSPLIGKPAPSFNLPSLQNPAEYVSSAQLKGHWYLFNVWGTWCYACRDEQGMLLEIHQSGLVPVIGLDWNDSRSDALEYLKSMGDPYERVAMDPNGSEAITWGVYGAPESFLVDPRGIIVYKCIGVITPQIWQKKILPLLVAGRAATVTS
jgi:cytochrome c biogenesis protein CcmG/thiol:disulfide interchange protein DsbE